MNDQDARQIEVIVTQKIELLVSPQLSAIMAMLESVIPKKPYDIPPLTADEVTPDGETYNEDGSVWGTSKGENGPEGTVYPMLYGYISERKDPVTWAQMKALGGANFDYWNQNRNPWSIYKNNPKSYLDTGVANWVTLSTMLLAVGTHQQ